MREITIKDDLGKVNYTIDIVRDIVLCAIAEIKSVCPVADTKKNSSVRLNAKDNDVYVEVFVKMMSDVAVNEVSADMQKSIKTAIETNTQYTVSAVDVHIVGVQFSENN